MQCRPAGMASLTCTGRIGRSNPVVSRSKNTTVGGRNLLRRDIPSRPAQRSAPVLQKTAQWRTEALVALGGARLPGTDERTADEDLGRVDRATEQQDATPDQREGKAEHRQLVRAGSEAGLEQPQ